MVAMFEYHRRCSTRRHRHPDGGIAHAKTCTGLGQHLTEERVRVDTDSDIPGTLIDVMLCCVAKRFRRPLYFTLSVAFDVT